MKAKKLLPAIILLILTLIAYAVATASFCYTTKPEVATGEFPFSITYEYKGETKTLTGVFECRFSDSNTTQGEHSRNWDGESRFDANENNDSTYIIDQNDELQTSLAIQTNLHAGYLMGDPLYQDYYETYGLEGAEPYIEYYDYKNDISLTEENREEILESIGFKLLDFSYPEPIENNFSFAGIQYEADNIIIFVAISLAFLLLCLIFVRKEPESPNTEFYKTCVVSNLLVGLIAIPFITILCFFFGLTESRMEAINLITYNTPPFSILCLALSIAFRRKGFLKTGFLIQFGGPLMLVLAWIAETLIDVIG